MAKLPQHAASTSTGPQPVTKKDFAALATFLAGKDGAQRMFKKDLNGEAVRTAGELYENREYVVAYETFKPAYDKVVGDMQRVLARNIEFAANELAQKLRKPLAIAKENVQHMRAHAQQVIDQFEKLRQDLESKPLVRYYLKKGGSAATATPPVEEAAATTIASADETQLRAAPPPLVEFVLGNKRYNKVPYAAPEPGTLYSVRDKTKGVRIIRVIAVSPDGAHAEVETVADGNSHSKRIRLAINSLVRQAEKGWCNVLLPIAELEESPAAGATTTPDSAPHTAMRLDSQNFGRCCGDIARAKINFSTQLIKDVGDGPFRAGKYEQAFLNFEQLAIGFNSAVVASRRAIEDGRRALTAEKGNLSGKEIQERTAAFVRNEQLIHTAEREFSTILEGLRMYLRANQG
jgi:hypothetical protein